MDDPWGSPWTKADNENHNAGRGRDDSSLQVPGLDPPPLALLSSSPSPRSLSALSVQAPWGEDDGGFGDWAAPNDAMAPAWIAGSARRSPSCLPLHDGLENGFGEPSPAGWTDSFFQLPRAKPAPTPDPWATPDIPALDREPSKTSSGGVIEAAQHEDFVALPTFSLPEAVTAQDEGRAGEELSLDRPVATEVDESTHLGHGYDASLVPPEEGSTATSERRSSSCEQSRGVSPSSENSGPPRHRHFSPDTSTDGDARGRLQEAERVNASKVQQLVHMYDGLARIAGLGPLPPSRHENNEISLVEADEADLESQRNAGFQKPSGRRSPELAPPREPNLTPTDIPMRWRRPSVGNAFHKGRKEMNSKSASDIPLGNIDKLYPADGGSIGEGGMTDVIQDGIIHDSFGAISERKAWYRVSRLGSSRKYNAGDDESYRRVAWPTSVVRDETIKALRRWLEVNSFSGPAHVGGSSGQSSMFGWDTRAEPVGLDDVFKRRRRSKPPATAAPQAAFTQDTSSTSTSPPPSTTSGWVAADPIDAFAGLDQWAGPPAEATKQRVGPEPMPSVADVSHQPTLRLFVNQEAASSSSIDSHDDDEDDWGEMVTPTPVEDGDTPAVASPAPFTPRLAKSPANGFANGSAAKRLPRDSELINSGLGPGPEQSIGSSLPLPMVPLPSLSSGSVPTEPTSLHIGGSRELPGGASLDGSASDASIARIIENLPSFAYMLI